MIPFNKPYLTGKEIQYIYQAIRSGKLSGDGEFTKKCHRLVKKKYGFKKVFLTNSCTDALEMAAILINVQPGDEVIIPSFTFVSTANAFILRGAKVIFADSEKQRPNINTKLIEPLITNKTKAIVPVHYAGIACKMDEIMDLAYKYDLHVIEDAAQAIGSYYKGKPLGSIGHLSTFSFHETKNIMSGEGGMLVVNDIKFEKRAEIIWEKGTNRAEFFRGEIDKYEWLDIGSSFLPSEITAAFLFAQLENISKIQVKRRKIWDRYYSGLFKFEKRKLLKLPKIPYYATNNAHLFYIICRTGNERDELLSFLNKNDILAVFHYQPLHRSKYFKNQHDGRELPMTNLYSTRLIRLPLYYELKEKHIDLILNIISDFFRAKINQ